MLSFSDYEKLFTASSILRSGNSHSAPEKHNYCEECGYYRLNGGYCRGESIDLGYDCPDRHDPEAQLED